MAVEETKEVEDNEVDESNDEDIIAELLILVVRMQLWN